MLTTLIIGLREGLEAALIIGIIAAFLRRNQRSLTPMWLGVGAALLLSIGLSVILELISASLDSAGQEIMEAVIAAVAVVLVTWMILWMSQHSRGLKSELESGAAKAIGSGSTVGLALMAFFAVLREGVETSVFLLAAFQSSVSPIFAGVGTLIGVGIAVILGYGIYRGALRLNLKKFFTITGVFLIFIAAGLVVKALRSLAESGVLRVGQEYTVDLSWLAPTGSIRATVLNGVFGIPSDPRVIEVLAWLLYVVPMLIITFWPAQRRPSGKALSTLATALAGSLVVLALALFLVTPQQLPVPDNVPLALGNNQGEVQLQNRALLLSGAVATSSGLQDAGDQRLDLPAESSAEDHQGVPSTLRQDNKSTVIATTELTLEELTQLNSGRTPVGIDPNKHKGPFAAGWNAHAKIRSWDVQGTLLDASSESSMTLTLSGGGLSSPRTVPLPVNTPLPATVSSTASNMTWQVDPDVAARQSQKLTSWQHQNEDLVLWRLWLPFVLLLAAGALGILALRSRSTGNSASEPPESSKVPLPPQELSDQPSQKKEKHVA